MARPIGYGTRPRQSPDPRVAVSMTVNGERVEPQFESGGGVATGAERRDLDVDIPPFDISEDIAADDGHPSDDWAPQPAPG